MPIYEYQCKEHGRFEKIFLTFDKPDMLPCPKCGQESAKAISRCSIKPDSLWSGVYDAGTGQTFTSASYRERWMKDRNLAVVERGMDLRQPSVEERIEAVQKKSEKALEKAVADEVMQLV